MQEFRTDKRLYAYNELKSWGIWLGIISLLMSLNYFFSIASHKSLLSGAAFFLFLRAIDKIKEYRVNRIIVDRESEKVSIYLFSILSGREKFVYDLQSISTDLAVNNMNSYFSKPAILYIKLPERKHFKITGRYGFTTKTLIEIHKELNVNMVPVSL